MTNSTQRAWEAPARRSERQAKVRTMIKKLKDNVDGLLLIVTLILSLSVVYAALVSVA